MRDPIPAELLRKRARLSLEGVTAVAAAPRRLGDVGVQPLRARARFLALRGVPELAATVDDAMMELEAAQSVISQLQGEVAAAETEAEGMR